MDKRIACRISCYQYVVIGVWRWPSPKTLLCKSTLQSSVVSAQCWCCFSMSFVGISRVSFCQHLLCVFGFIYIASKSESRHKPLSVKQELRLPPLSFLGVWQTEVTRCLLKEGSGRSRLKCFAIRLLNALFYLHRRPPHLFTTRTGSTFLCRDQVSKVRWRPPSVDHRHRREGQPHSADHRQASDHRSCASGGHSEREPHAWCHLLM